MSQHPSLRSKSKSTKFRSVLKRFERLRHLKEKEKWNDEMSVFGLPKIKVLKFKIKKEKATPAEVKVEAGVQAAPQAAAAKTDIKAAPQASEKTKTVKKDQAPKKESK